MSTNENTQLQAVIIIISFIIISGGGWYLFNNAHSLSIASASVNSACTNDTSNQTPPSITQFNWQDTGLITLWFDDAWKTTYQTAYPVMQKYGFAGAIAVPVNYVCYPAFMSWDELRTLQSKGWETTSHSRSHNCHLAFYNDDTIKSEVIESKEILKRHGLRADNFVMPCGYTEAGIKSSFIGAPPPIIETVKKNYASYRTTNGTRINTVPLQDPYNLKAVVIRNNMNIDELKKLVDQAATQKGWLILVFHQIDDSKSEFSISKTELETILTMVKDSNLPVVLPSQVIAIHGK